VAVIGPSANPRGYTAITGDHDIKLVDYPHFCIFNVPWILVFGEK
jgi:hypothetical protein